MHISVSLAPTSAVRLARLQYVLHFLQQHPAAPKDCRWSINAATADKFIPYGNASPVRPPAYAMPALGFFFVHRPPEYAAATLVTTRFVVDGRTVQGWGRAVAQQPFVIDVFETLFFHLSRWEEWYIPADRHDAWGALRTELHYLVQAGLQETPVVDYLVRYVYTALDIKPLDAPTTYQMTHDIDVLEKFPSFYKYLRTTANQTLRAPNKFRALRQNFWQYVRRKNPFDSFAWLLMPANNRFDRKVLFMMSGGITRYDNHYAIQSQAAMQVMRLAQERGYEIGLHPSFSTPADAALWATEKKILEVQLQRAVTLSRQHFLRFDMARTPAILTAVGIDTDFTLGYQEGMGFRCGTGFAYQPYNFSTEQPFPVRVQPMAVMDCALLVTVGWESTQFSARLRAFLAANKQYTCIVFNFHNSTFDDALLDATALKDIYLSLP